jgi:hypothetical protein
MAVAEALPIAPPSEVISPARVRQSPKRLDYLDTLKVALTALVIAHHAGQPYGPTGGAWPLFNAERAGILGPFFSVNAAFFMGLFFLISAYFLPVSFDRKGAKRFLSDRALRLGVPLVVVGVTIGAVDQHTFEPAHMWFVAHLLVYAGLYAAWRGLKLPGISMSPPSHREIFGYALALAGVTTLVRLAGFPMDRWVTLFGVLPIEVAHLPQYASLFAIGLIAARGQWMTRLPTRTGMIWLAVGLVLAALRYAWFLVLGDGPGSVLWSTWESFLCVGLCVGLPVLFRERSEVFGRLQKLAPNAYGAYVIHVLPVIVGLQFALANVNIDPFSKFALVTLIGVPLSFALAAGLRRLPGVRAVL